MSENKRNVMVAIFVLGGLSALGWLIFKFGDLPAWLSSYAHKEVTIHFSQAPGVRENTDVLFRGYAVGRVVSILPPALLDDLGDSERQYYQVLVIVALEPDFSIPANVSPKVYPRGLGSSYIELTLDGAPSERLLKSGDRIKGGLSEASGFISESTQKKLDTLLASLSDLIGTLEGQLVSRPPELVDISDPNVVRPNVTTAVIRMDTVLKNLNAFVADVENQKNFRQGMADFGKLAGELRNAISSTEAFAAEAQKLVEHTSGAITRAEGVLEQAYQSFDRLSVKSQYAADELAGTLQRFNVLLERVTDGSGTAGRIVNDPRMYESITDAGAKLSLALDEFRELLAQWKADGVKMKVK